MQTLEELFHVTSKLWRIIFSHIEKLTGQLADTLADIRHLALQQKDFGHLIRLDHLADQQVQQLELIFPDEFRGGCHDIKL